MSGALLTPQRENIMVLEMVSIAEVVVGARRASDGALLCISGCKSRHERHERTNPSYYNIQLGGPWCGRFSLSACGLGPGVWWGPYRKPGEGSGDP